MRFRPARRASHGGFKLDRCCHEISGFEQRRAQLISRNGQVRTHFHGLAQYRNRLLVLLQRTQGRSELKISDRQSRLQRDHLLEQRHRFREVHVFFEHFGAVQQIHDLNLVLGIGPGVLDAERG